MYPSAGSICSCKKRSRSARTQAGCVQGVSFVVGNVSISSPGRESGLPVRSQFDRWCFLQNTGRFQSPGTESETGSLVINDESQPGCSFNPADWDFHMTPTIPAQMIVFVYGKQTSDGVCLLHGAVGTSGA